MKYQPRGSRAFINAAIFEHTQQNVFTTSPIDPDFLQQTGEVRVRGFEIEGKASLSDNLDVIAGYGYLQPIISKGDEDDPVNDITRTTGNDLSNVSRHTASLWAMYTWRHGMLAGLGLGAGIRYVSTQYADDLNENKIPAYTLVDAAVSFDLKYASPNLEGAKLQLNAYNLFDEYYIAACTGGPNFCGFGADRSFIATLKYDW